jgi:hypothetical protein
MVDVPLPQERHEFYVYIIFRPNGDPCYIGKGIRGRWKQHIIKSHNRRLRHIVAKAEREGLDIPILKIREHLSNDEASETEIAFIAAIGRADLGLGPLVNLTDGGEGAPGWVPTGEYRKRQSERQTGRKFRGDHLANVQKVLVERNKSRIGIPHSDGHNAKIAMGNRGKWEDPDYRYRVISRATIGANRPEAKAARAARNATPETQRRRSEAASACWNDPSFRMANAATWTPERKARTAERTRRLMANPVINAQITAKRRATLLEQNKDKPLTPWQEAQQKRAVRGSPAHVAKVVALHTGRKRSQETCDRIGNGVRGKKRTDEQKLALSVARKGVPKSESHRLAMKVSGAKRRAEKAGAWLIEPTADHLERVQAIHDEYKRSPPTGNPEQLSLGI